MTAVSKKSQHGRDFRMMNYHAFTLKAADARETVVVQDRVLFILEEESFRQFTAMLDAPTDSNTGIERLAAIKTPWSAGNI